MDKIKKIWTDFENKHPKLSVWVREGGLFLIVSILITIFKYLILTFLPEAFSFLGNRDFGFPGTKVTLFGVSFKWYIIGYGADQGGVAYFTAYMIAMVIGEVINFLIQRKYVFRSNGNIWYQGAWYLLAFCIVTCVVNSINCVWVAVASGFVKGWVYNIVTTMLNGCISMVVFFIVNKIIFKDGANAQKNEVATVEQAVAAAEETADSINNMVGSAEDTVASLEQTLAALQEAVAALNEALSATEEEVEALRKNDNTPKKPE